MISNDDLLKIFMYSIKTTTKNVNKIMKYKLLEIYN